MSRDEDIRYLREQVAEAKDAVKGNSAELWVVVHDHGTKIAAMEKHMAVMDERVGTLVKFVDRLVNAVYAAAGSIFVAAVAVIIFQQGLGG
jgi:streptomycin 6-kinase